MQAGKGGASAVGASTSLGGAQERGWRRGPGRRQEARGSSRLESRGEKKEKKKRTGMMVFGVLCRLVGG
jgi:hypothetical protein